jgi:hypothetical protein
MLTTAQLITLALQDARKAGSLGTGFSPQAGQKLNLILNELNLLYDLPMATASATVTLTGSPTGPPGWVGMQPGVGPYNLPANYLRMAQDELVYSFQGAPQKMINVDLAQIDFQGMLQLNTNYPENFATDINTAITTGFPSLYVWPPPSGAITLNFRYFSLQPDIATPETGGTQPWMQLGTYLLARLTGEMLEPDPRADRFHLKAEKLLQTYLATVDDNEGRAMIIKLDPRNFGGGRGDLRRTKGIDF